MGKELSDMRMLFLLAILFVPVSGFSSDYYYMTKNTNSVTWTAVGFPGFLRINGTGGKVSGELKSDGNKVYGRLEVALTSFVTGIKSRDKHMHDKYLDTKKYRVAVLDLAEYKIGGEEFSGTLTIKGEKKPVKGKIDLKCGVTSCAGTAKFVVKITDYPAIGVPSYLGVTVAEKVDVEVTFVANKIEK